MRHADANGILKNNQHGFRPRRSPKTQLILTVDEIAKQLDEGNLVDKAILVFQKAFVKVPNRRPIHKLCRYGMSGQIANWVEDFLTVRSQRVMIERKLSAKAPVLFGVPQGTVFGPMLSSSTLTTWQTTFNLVSDYLWMTVLWIRQQTRIEYQQHWGHWRSGKTTGWCLSIPVNVSQWL